MKGPKLNGENQCGPHVAGSKTGGCGLDFSAMNQIANMDKFLTWPLLTICKTSVLVELLKALGLNVTIYQVVSTDWKVLYFSLGDTSSPP